MPTERALIAAFRKPFPKARIPVGPGDDAAVVAGASESLCITTDAIVEGVHFSRRHFAPEDIGHKALAVNLSDLAAMGATPRWFVCALGLPRGTSRTFVEGVARGMAVLSRTHRIALIGGNFSRAREVSLTLTCAGGVPAGKALRRDAGRPGDLLYVSGTLGDARSGLRALRSGRSRGDDVERQRRPVPRVSLGLIARGFARAAMDVSDGLAQDLSELCRQSGVGAEVRADQLPVSVGVREGVGSARRAARLALSGGEDYELLLAVPPAVASAFERACERGRQRVTRIGRLVRGERIRFLWDEVSFRPPSGFDHFA